MVRLTFMAHLQLGSPRCQNRRRRIRVFWSFPCCVTEPFSASSNKPRHLSLFATVAPHPENGSLERAAIARVNSKISEESATCLWAPHSKIRHDKTFWGLWCPKASPKQMKTPSECWSGLGVRTGAGAGKTRIQIVFVIRNLPGSLPAKPSIWDANLNSDHSAPGCNNQDQEAQCSPPSSAMTGCLRAGHSLPTR